MKSESLTNEIDWFFYHLVRDRIIDKAMCVNIMDTLEEAGLIPSISFIIQVMLENGLYQDKSALERLKRSSVEEGRTGPCPMSVFAAPRRTVINPAAPPRRDEPAPRREPAIQRVSGSGTAWLEGWPNLNAARDLKGEASRKLLDDFLHKARQAGCSDVHISAGAYPFVRKHKEMYLVPGQEILSPEAAAELNYAPLSDDQRSHFDDHHDLDYSYNISTTDRYRTNLLYQRFGCSGSYRIINNRITPIRELGFKQPEILEKLTTHNQGLILITGPAGSGKSTTLSSMVDFINQNRHDHIITVEDPIEIIYIPKGCNITQRELNHHTRSFTNALRAALREDPDVIVIGEMRDLETIEMAIHSSETGHLVFGTLHTTGAAETIDRIIDAFPTTQQAQVRTQLSACLVCVISQVLLKRIDKKGRVAAFEIMVNTPSIASLIRDGKTFRITSDIQTGAKYGMNTLDTHLIQLYNEGKINYGDLITKAKDPEGVIQRLKMEFQNRQ